MTLIVAWITALFGMALLLLWGAIRSRAFDGFVHAHIHGVVKEDISHVSKRASMLIQKMRPRVEGIAVASAVFVVRRGARVSAMFSRHVLGRIEFEKGKASSFFLKRIAEEKGERRSPSAILEDGY